MLMTEETVATTCPHTFFVVDSRAPESIYLAADIILLDQISGKFASCVRLSCFRRTGWDKQAMDELNGEKAQAARLQ